MLYIFKISNSGFKYLHADKILHIEIGIVLQKNVGLKKSIV